jgi:hypothetical protein
MRAGNRAIPAAVLFAATMLAISATPQAARGMYDPKHGRWLQRDPGPSVNTSVRVGLAPRVGSGTFVPRGPINTAPPNNAPPHVGQAGMNNEYVDGMNLYQYAVNNPLRFTDPQGTDIYLKTGNNSGNPVNDAIHQNVCVDTWDNHRRGELACFSFGATSRWPRFFSIRRTWLGWRLPIWQTTGLCALEGEIYEDENVGEWVSVKGTTPEQDQKWLNWMRTKRVGTKDVYTVGWFNCRNYSQREYDDAPGNH